MASGNQTQMILDAFNSEIYVSNRMDVQHTPLYDTVTIAAGSALNTNTSQFFTNVGSASNKTIGQTNMTQSQKLPAPQAFSIFSIRLLISPDILLADLESIFNTLCLELYLGDKVYQRAPLWYFAAGGGISGYFTTSQTAVFTNGLPARESIHKLAIPIVIENQMTFYAQLNGTAYTMTAGASGGTGITMQLLLDGLYARGVQ